MGYGAILATLVGMINHPETWIITNNQLRETPELYATDEFDKSLP